ncbi:MAG TPA: hypothetical protein DCP92_16860 [Nitrospiraceae bacterium]|nr:hypothetical protein [Nitrospiraceae bacterium]
MQIQERKSIPAKTAFDLTFLNNAVGVDRFTESPGDTEKARHNGGLVALKRAGDNPSEQSLGIH